MAGKENAIPDEHAVPPIAHFFHLKGHKRRRDQRNESLPVNDIRLPYAITDPTSDHINEHVPRDDPEHVLPNSSRFLILGRPAEFVVEVFLLHIPQNYLFLLPTLNNPVPYRCEIDPEPFL